MKRNAKMRLFLAVAAAAMLSACSDTGEKPTSSVVDASDDVAEPASVEITPGLYAVGDETTEYGRTRLNADGTYVDLNGDKPVAEGTWTTDGAVMCFDPVGDDEDQKERCWVNEPANSDGSFISNRDDGSQSYVVTPLER